MKTRHLLLPAICQIFLLLTGAALTAAQTSAPQMPPPVPSIFREEIKAGRSAALEKANIESGFATYQVVSGAPGGTYLVFSAVKSLAEMDAMPANQRAINQALGAEDGQKLLKGISDSFLTTESTLFAFSPKMSYVSKEFAAGDPDFWTPKLAAAAKPAAAPKKQVAKAGGNQ